MLFSRLPVEKNQCIKRPLFENLSVIPYVKGRLVFAELAVRAIQEGCFDIVLVDMPYFMNDKRYLSAAVSALPLVNSLALKKRDSGFVNIPLAPNDAACAAIAMAQMLRNEGSQIGLQCIDDSNVVNYHEYLRLPHINLKDDYLVFVEGLDKYFELPFRQLADVWKNLAETQRYFLRYRAGMVKKRLEGHLKEGKNTLFICEYSLWRLVSEMLGKKIDEENVPFIPWQDIRAAIVLEDPYIFWAMGLLDDYPAVVHQFFKTAKKGWLLSFDKLEGINEIISRSVSSGLGNPSVRKIKSFYHYLYNRLSFNSRITPLPVEDLYDAALCCVGRTFAKKAAEEFLNYPYPNAEKAIEFLTVNKDNLIFKGKAFQIPDMSEQSCLYPHNNGNFTDGSFESRIKVVNRVRPFLTTKEMNMLKNRDYWPVIWETENDYSHHQAVCGHVRNMAMMQARQADVRIVKSYGSMGDGIHWKSTIRSIAAGENAIYIKKRASKAIKRSTYDLHTPIVFIFAEDFSGNSSKAVYDANQTQRNIDLMNNTPFDKTEPPPDSVYSVFYTYGKEGVLCGGHIFKNHITSIAFLYTKDMGVKRYTSITKRDKRFQCRAAPYSDPELSVFPLSELGAAWAIKYAQDAVLIAARDGWSPSQKLRDFAGRKKIEMIRLSLSRFSPETIERMRMIHSISTPLKKHPERDGILKRFIE